MANVYWKGGTSTDFAVAANWLDATGAALGRVPGQAGFETDAIKLDWALPGAAGNPENMPTTNGGITATVASIDAHADVGLNLGPNTVNATGVTVTGNVTMTNTGIGGAVVEGNVTMACPEGPPSSIHSLTIGGDLTVTAADDTTEIDDCNVTGDTVLTYGKIVSTAGDCVFQGDLTATGTVGGGDFTVEGDLTADAFIRDSGAATITGDADLSDSTCIVDGYTFDGLVTINDAMTLGTGDAPVFNGIVNDLGGASWLGADADAEGSVVNIRGASQIAGGDYSLINVMADCQLAVVTSAAEIRLYASCQVDAGFGATSGNVIHLMSKNVVVDGGGGDYLPNASQLPTGAVSQIVVG